MNTKFLHIGLIIMACAFGSAFAENRLHRHADLKGVQPLGNYPYGGIASFDPSNSADFVPLNANKRIAHIATASEYVYASFENVVTLSIGCFDLTANPAKLYAWHDAYDATAFCTPAAGPISKIAASCSFVGTLNSACLKTADIWSSCGDYLAGITIDSVISDMALSTIDDCKHVFLAHDKHFDRYDSDGTYVDTYPVVNGQVTQLATHAGTNYIFTINNNTNNIEAWDNQSGVLVSSIAAEGVVNPNLFIARDGYVFAVLSGDCDTQRFLYVYDFTTITDPSLLGSIEALGMIQNMAVTSEGGPSVFINTSFIPHNVFGWHVTNEGCEPFESIEGFNPLVFDCDVALLAASYNYLTVYGFDGPNDFMRSYSYADGCSPEVLYGDASAFNIPQSTITLLATTNSGQAFAVFENAPTKVQGYDADGGHAYEFCHPAAACITQLVAAESLVIAVADNKAYVYQANGDYVSTIDPCGCITDVVIASDNFIYVAVGNVIKKYATCGHLEDNFDGNAYAKIFSLTTTDNSPFIYAVTADDSIIAFDVCMGSHAGRYKTNGTISLVTCLSDGVVLFVYENCKNLIHMIAFVDPCCCPFEFNTIDVGDDINLMIASSSDGDQVYVVRRDSNNQVQGYWFEDGCSGSEPICMFNPLAPDLGTIDFLVKGWSNLFIAGDGFLQSYAYNGGGDINTIFNVNEQLTHLTSTFENRVYATFASDKDTIYMWNPDTSDDATAFEGKAAGPIAALTSVNPLTAWNDFVVSMTEDADYADIWLYDGTKIGRIQTTGINAIAVNDINSDEEDCECTGSVYLAQGQHFNLYNSCGTFVRTLPQVSGTVTHLAAPDNEDMIYATNSDNNLIEAYTQSGVFVSNVTASGNPSALVAKHNKVFEVNGSTIEVFDFSTPASPSLIGSVTADGVVSAIAALHDAQAFYVLNNVTLNDIQGWTVSCEGCDPIAPLETYDPATIEGAPIINMIAADIDLFVVAGQAPLGDPNQIFFSGPC